MTATTVPEIESRPMTWEQYHESGRRRFAEGDAAGAEQAFRGAIAEAEQPGGDPLQMASSLSSLGQLKYQQKDYAQAEDCFRRALELREQALGGDHPTVISSINNLAALYVARGALDDAEPLLQRAMAVTIKRVEASQADLAVNLNNLVRLYVKRGDYSRAEPMLTQLLAMKRPLGPEHPEVAAVLVTLAKLRQSMAQPDAAERIWRRVLAVRERTLPVNDTTIAATLDGLADACGAQGRLADELEMRERSLAIREVAQGPDHPSLPAIRTRVAELRQIAPPRVIDPAGTATQRVSSPAQRTAPVEWRQRQRLPGSDRAHDRHQSRTGTPVESRHDCVALVRIHGVAGRPHLGTRQPGVGRDARQARVGGGAVCAAAHGYPGGIRPGVRRGYTRAEPRVGCGCARAEPRVGCSCARGGPRVGCGCARAEPRVGCSCARGGPRVGCGCARGGPRLELGVRITQPGH